MGALYKAKRRNQQIVGAPLVGALYKAKRRDQQIVGAPLVGALYKAKRRDQQIVGAPLVGALYRAKETSAVRRGAPCGRPLQGKTPKPADRSGTPCGRPPSAILASRIKMRLPCRSPSNTFRLPPVHAIMPCHAETAECGSGSDRRRPQRLPATGLGVPGRRRLVLGAYPRAEVCPALPS